MSEIEVITACENVCRDFNWLGSFSDWAPTLLASATALVIAFIAYPWQKKEDRKLQIELEQRKAYEELVALFLEARFQFGDFKFEGYQSTLDSLSKIRAAKQALLVRAHAASAMMHADIAPFVNVCLESADDILREVCEELKQVVEGLNSDDGISAKELQKRCQPFIDTAVGEFDGAILKLVKEIRVRVYKLPGFDGV